MTTRAEQMVAAPQAACNLAAALTKAGWLWQIGGHRNPDRNALRVVGVDPATSRGVQANWEGGRLHSCVVWDPVTREVSLTAARALIGERR